MLAEQYGCVRNGRWSVADSQGREIGPVIDTGTPSRSYEALRLARGDWWCDTSAIIRVHVLVASCLATFKPDVSHRGRSGVFDTGVVAKRNGVIEHGFTLADHHWDEYEVEFIDQPGAQILTHGGRAAHQAYVFSIGHCDACSRVFSILAVVK
jgi:hypothetical protein